MDRDVSRRSMKINNTECTIQISDDVIAMIAALAATEVDGVTALYGNANNKILRKVGFKNVKSGVRVEVFSRKVRIHIALIMEYGYNIPGTCQQVQTRVQSVVESMTNLKVTDVDVRIAGVNVKKTGEK